MCKITHGSTFQYVDNKEGNMEICVAYGNMWKYALL